MAAAYLPKPGTKYGPCKGKCNHTDCNANRSIAADVCRFCNEPIGFDSRYYSDPEVQGKAVHAYCLEDHYEARRPKG